MGLAGWWRHRAIVWQPQANTVCDVISPRQSQRKQAQFPTGRLERWRERHPGSDAATGAGAARKPAGREARWGWGWGWGGWGGESVRLRPAARPPAQGPRALRGERSGSDRLLSRSFTNRRGNAPRAVHRTGTSSGTCTCRTSTCRRRPRTSARSGTQTRLQLFPGCVNTAKTTTGLISHVMDLFLNSFGCFYSVNPFAEKDCTDSEFVVIAR